MFSKATDRSEPAAKGRGSSGTPSIISADMRVSGDLRTEGDVQIDGIVDGDIQSHTVTVGQSAEINGEVVADAIVVWGRINGRIRCKDVTLEESAEINGDVLHDSLQVARGARVEGMVKRGAAEERGAKVNLVVADGEPRGGD